MKTIYSTMLIILALAALFWYATAFDLPPKLAAFVDKLRGALRSKTVRFNALALLLLDQLPNFVDYLGQNLPGLQPFIPANRYQFLLGAITIANIILRFKTTQPLGAK